MANNRRGRSKSRATRQRARDLGRRSGFEVKVEEALRVEHRDPSEDVEYEAERIKYPRKDGTYVPDFRVPVSTWRTKPVYFEAKGRFLSSDRAKLLAVKKAHPDLDLRLVFQRNQPLYKGAKTRYTDWADAHGFRSSIFPELPL